MEAYGTQYSPRLNKYVLTITIIMIIGHFAIPFEILSGVVCQ